MLKINFKSILIVFVTVADSECSMCRAGASQAVLTGDRGSIASITTQEETNNGCGTVMCPWRIKVKSK
jgi:hypothetical protein